MSFWIIAFSIATLGVAPIALAMRKASGPGADAASSAELRIGLYKEQLAEVERDLARGVLNDASATRTRTEISRRLLEADKTRASARSSARAKQTPLWAVATIAFAALIATGLLYRELGATGYEDLPLERRMELARDAYLSRPAQEILEEEVGPFEPQVGAEHLELIEKLRTAMQLRPNDTEGLALLVRNEALIGNAKAAYEAQERLIALKGDAASTGDYEILADLMIQAGGGFVSPEAEAVLQKVLKLDPRNGAALYYTGVMFRQNGRPDLTFKFWEPLLNRSSPSDPWTGPIRAQIETVADTAGVRYTLEPITASSTLSGPSAEDVAAASEMSEEDRAVMIRSMVDGLSDRLASEGGSAHDWARLITALGVLGELSRAQDIWKEAQATFGDDPDMIGIIRSAARDAGLLQ